MKWKELLDQLSMLLGKPLCRRAACFVSLFSALPFPSFLSIEFLSLACSLSNTFLKIKTKLTITKAPFPTSLYHAPTAPSIFQPPPRAVSSSYSSLALLSNSYFISYIQLIITSGRLSSCSAFSSLFISGLACWSTAVATFDKRCSCCLSFSLMPLLANSLKVQCFF